MKTRMKARRQRRTQRIQVYLLVYFLCFVATTVSLAVLGDWIEYLKLSRNNRNTVGRIVGTDVEYIVEGKNYTISAPLIRVISEYGFTVLYYPPNPQIACVCNPQESLATESWWVILLASGFSLLILFGYHHFRKDYWD